MKRWTIPLAVLVALGVAAAGYWGFRSAKPAASQVQTAPPTVPVERGAVWLGVTAPGRLVGKRETVLSFGATGKLVDLPVRAGQHVAEGATLARLDPAPLQERVAIAQTELELARARLAKLQAGPTTADTAAAQGDLARAQARLDELNRGPNAGELAAARADLAAAEAALAQLKSPDAAALQNAHYALETAKNSLWSAQVARDAACGGPDKRWHVTRARPRWATPTPRCARRRTTWPASRQGRARTNCAWPRPMSSAPAAAWRRCASRPAKTMCGPRSWRTSRRKPGWTS